MSTIERTDSLDLSPLSPREREVLDPAMEGLSAREIATRLSLTEATVRSHLSTIYSKLGVASRVELMARVNGAAPTSAAGPAAEHDPSTSAAVPLPPRRRRRRAFAIAGILLIAVSAAALVLLTRSDPGTRTDVATVSALISSGQVATMVVHDQTLTVTQRDGTRLMVDPVSAFGVEPMVQAAIAAGVEVRVENPPSLDLGTVFAAGVVVSIVALAMVLIVVVWFARRRPPLRSAG